MIDALESTKFKENYSLEELSLAERKQALLELLKTIDTVLVENNLDYLAYYGTLLGCVRHQGFIPWDDDIDLAMPRDDYDKLKLINWNHHGLELQSPQTLKNFACSFAKISDPSFFLVEPVQNGEIASGLNIDIFPLDMVSDSKFEIRSRLVRVLAWLTIFKVVKDDPSRPFFKRFLLRLGRTVLWPVSVGSINRHIDTISSRGKASAHTRMGCIAGPYRRRDIMPMDWIKDRETAKFSDIEIPIPSKYHQILGRLYGDYMKLPPENKRITHHLNALYRKVPLVQPPHP